MIFLLLETIFLLSQKRSEFLSPKTIFLSYKTNLVFRQTKINFFNHQNKFEFFKTKEGISFINKFV